jgi:hypothetical protein
MLIHIEGTVTNAFTSNAFISKFISDNVSENDYNFSKIVEIGSSGNDNFINYFFKVILSSSALIIIPTSVIYYFGTLYSLRTVNRSKEDTCIHGFHFVVIFIIVPSILFCISYQIGLLHFLQNFLQYYLGLDSSEYFPKIALLTITVQFFSVISLSYILQDSDNILKERLFKWPGFNHLD